MESVRCQKQPLSYANRGLFHSVSVISHVKHSHVCAQENSSKTSFHSLHRTMTWNVAYISAFNNATFPVWAELDGKIYRSVHRHRALCCCCYPSVMVGSVALGRAKGNPRQASVRSVYLLHTRTIQIINKMRLCNLCTLTVWACVWHVKVMRSRLVSEEGAMRTSCGVPIVNQSK